MDKEWIIIGIIVAVFLAVCAIVSLVKNYREKKEYNRSFGKFSYRKDSSEGSQISSQGSSSYPSRSDESERINYLNGRDKLSEDVEPEEEPEEDETYPEQLEECRERVGKLIKVLEAFWSIKAIENFDEDEELLNEGYMFSLIELMIDLGRMWVIFYPNENWSVAALIFDQKVPWAVVQKAKNIIDEFTGDDEPDSYPYDGEGYLAYIWNGGDCDDLRDDITKVAEKNPTWKGLLDQVNIEGEADSGNDEDNIDPERLRECQVRAYELIMSLKSSYPTTVTENFDEDRELRSEGY
ncbi:MAG: hypothetical protein PHY93_20930, partial [Bacteriovorax sp.]|nr:hypothetical protein [Bacteriovorax sp.]